MNEVTFEHGLGVYGIFLPVDGLIEQQGSGIDDQSSISSAMGSDHGHGIVFKQMFGSLYLLDAVDDELPAVLIV